MFKNEYFRIGLLSVIFSLSVLVALPKIPVVVNNKLLKLDSYIGGYEVKFPGGKPTLDLKDFKGGLDVAGGTKLVFQVDTAGSNDSQKIIKDLVKVVKNRMDVAGFSDYEVGVESEKENKIYVTVTKFIYVKKVIGLVTGSGRINFKKMKNPESWSPENAAKVFADPAAWDPTDITEKDVSTIRISKAATGKTQIQIVFTDSGRKKFFELVKNLVDKPIAIHANDSIYPFAVPIISESLVNNPNADPVITGDFQEDALKNFVLQMKFGPLPAQLSSVENFSVDARMGNNFISKYAKAVLVGLVLVLALFVFKFRKFGFLFGVSFLISSTVFLAFFKIFSLVVNIPSIVGLVVFVLLVTDISYVVIKRLRLETLREKPFDLALFQVFEKSKGAFETPVIFIFILMFFVFSFSSGEIRSFVSAVMLGMLLLLFHYSFVLKVLLEVFGRKGR